MMGGKNRRWYSLRRRPGPRRGFLDSFVEDMSGPVFSVFRV